MDAKRSKVFAKIAREITIAAKLHGGDASMNPRLRLGLLKARGANMPAENIQRAINRGTGDGESASFVDLTYEIYGPHGAAILCEVSTDNRNRTAAEVRLAFSKHGGNLGETGCVSYLFQHRSEVRLEGHCNEEPLLESLIELDAEGYVLESDGNTMVHGGFEALEELQQGLQDRGWTLIDWEHCWHPLVLVEIQDPDLAESCQRLEEALESLDDVCSVSTNLAAIDVQQN